MGGKEVMDGLIGKSEMYDGVVRSSVYLVHDGNLVPTLLVTCLVDANGISPHPSGDGSMAHVSESGVESAGDREGLAIVEVKTTCFDIATPTIR